MHWFETIVSLTAKSVGLVMSIVRHADDFVILERKRVDGFLQKVERALEERMELTVNREKTRTLDFREPHTTLTFLGYDFRMVRDRLFGTGKRYLTFGPSKKSMKRIREKIHEITHARNGLLTVEKVVGRLDSFVCIGLAAGLAEAIPAAEVRSVYTAGNDAADGKTAQTVWRMMTKVCACLPAGATVRLKCGDVLYGHLRLPSVPDEAHQAVLTRWEDGPKPVISETKNLEAPSVVRSRGIGRFAWAADGAKLSALCALAQLRADDQTEQFRNLRGV